ncbi:hypothetical protein Tco_0430224, partial [Tanacetum coccineum]
MTLLATTVDQRLTTVDRWLTGGPAVVNGGPSPLTVVDRRWPIRGCHVALLMIGMRYCA